MAAAPLHARHPLLLPGAYAHVGDRPQRQGALCLLQAAFDSALTATVSL